jgi:hypothetical protein
MHLNVYACGFCSVYVFIIIMQWFLDHITTQQYLLSRIIENTILHARKITGISQLDQD